jgi:DNA-entry nuclease
MNVDGMLPFENSVAQYIREIHNHVYYNMVRPIYENNELVARGVLIETYSIEDGGKGICYNLLFYTMMRVYTIAEIDSISTLYLGCIKIA